MLFVFMIGYMAVCASDAEGKIMVSDNIKNNRPVLGNGNSLKNLFPFMVLSWFPAAIAFLLVPFSIYIPNQEEYGRNISVLIPYIALLTASIIFIAVIFRLWPDFSKKAAFFFFYFGVLIVVSDIVAPLRVGEIMVGWDAPPIPEPLSSIFFEISAAVVVIALAIKIPKRYILRFAPTFVLIMVVVQCVFVLKDVKRSQKPSNANVNESAKGYQPKENDNHNSNVYHVTFDAFSSGKFIDLLEEEHSREEFDGFVFFPNNKSNYLFTWMSRASYMNGDLYKSGSLEEWFNAWKEGGLFGELHDAGYIISDYKNIGSSKIHYSRLKDIDFKSGLKMIKHFHFADLWLLRLAPAILNQEVYNSSKNSGLISRFARTFFISSGLDFLPVKHKIIMEALIEDEVKRSKGGNYVWAHLYLPHGPYNLDRDCAYKVDVGYDEQAMCAIKLMSDFIAELKRQGKYHDSMIIFQSDHGGIGISNHDMSADIMEKIDATNSSGRSAQAIINLSSSLLMVKPPNSSGKPLVVSEKLTQLTDIPASVYALTGIEADPGDGVNVLDDAFNEDRTIDIYTGYLQRGEDGGFLTYGKGISEGYFDHYRYSLVDGWSIDENLRVTW